MEEKFREADFFIQQIEVFIQGLLDVKRLKRLLIAQIEAAAGAKQKTIAVSLRRLLPEFLKAQIIEFFGENFLNIFFGLNDFEVDPSCCAKGKSCKAVSKGNIKKTIQVDLTKAYAMMGAFGWILKKVLGNPVSVTFKEEVSFSIDCGKLKTCTLSITGIKGVSFKGTPDPHSITIDTKKGKASISLGPGGVLSRTLMDLQSFIDQLNKAIREIEKELEKMEEGDDKRRATGKLERLKEKRDTLQREKESLREEETGAEEGEGGNETSEDASEEKP